MRTEGQLVRVGEQQGTSAVLVGVPGGTSSRVSVTCPPSRVNDVVLCSSTAEWSDN